jgi:CheY-like chemotaxis protein
MDRLLIVDDNIELLCLYKKMLSLYGKYDIAGMAGNGRDAVSKYKRMKKKPDLVLMDVNMPEVDGISAAREIRLYDSRARIVFITAEQVYNSDLPAELSGAPILRKPFSRDEFMLVIGKALKGGRRLKKCQSDDN